MTTPATLRQRIRPTRTPLPGRLPGALAAACTVAWVVGLAGCASDSKTASGGASAAAPQPGTLEALRGAWRCTAILGAPVTGDGAPTIDFREGGRAGGLAGVNRYGCEATSAAPGALKLGAIAATRMAGPPERMELEGSFLAALQRVTGAQVSGQMLELTSESGTVLRFERASAPARQ